jgi:hypothetical protein
LVIIVSIDPTWHSQSIATHAAAPSSPRPSASRAVP